MKAKKLITAFLMFAVILMISIFTNSVSADSLGYLTTSEEREADGEIIKHQIYRESREAGLHRIIWKLVQSNQAGVKKADTVKDLYCLRAGLGFTSIGSGAGEKTVVYDEWGSMTNHQGLVNYFNSVDSETTIFNAEDSENFYAVMWILDNMLLEGASDDEVNAFLKTYAGYDDTSLNLAYYKENVLSRADIDAIQQLAIWYFTNAKDKDGNVDEVYHKDVTESGVTYPFLTPIFISVDGGEFKTMAMEYNDPVLGRYGDARTEAAEKLYRNLIETAKQAVRDNSGTYTTTGRRKIRVYLAGNGEFATQQPVVRVEENKEVDVALRKFITEIKTKDGETVKLTGTNSREPKVDTSKLNEFVGGELQTTAIYNHRKDAVKVSVGDVVTYTLRIFNEGDTDVYVKEVTDYLPEFLEYQDDTSGSWTLDGASLGRVAITTPEFCKITAVGGKIAQSEVGKLLGDVKIPAAEYNVTATSDEDKYTLSYVDIQISCKVMTGAPVETNITNVAQITKMTDENGVEIKTEDQERDSIPNGKFTLPTDDKLPDYTGGKNKGNDPYYDESNVITTNNGKYYPGQEDDDDFEKIKIVLPDVDLSLRKFISAVAENETSEAKILTGSDSREPKVNTTPLDTNASTTAEYYHPKTPVTVKKGSLVTYTIRVYNEGEINAYANKITDYLPNYLIYLEDNEVNKLYRWNYDRDTRQVTTTILSKANDKIVEVLPSDYTPEKYPYYTSNTNLLLAYDQNTMTDGPHYREVKIVCKVDENAIGNKILTNLAQITEIEDETRKLEKDEDSFPDKNMILPEDSKRPDYTGGKNEKNDPYYDESNVISNEKGKYYPGQEDDDDFEKVLVKPEFDLALRKFITKVGTTNVNNRYPEVLYIDGEIIYAHPKDPVEVAHNDTVIYTIRVYNEGELDGYANEITDDVPEGLEFLPDNETNTEYRWKMLDENQEVTEDVSKAKYIITDYLSDSQERATGRINVIKAFNKEAEISENNPDFKEVKIAFKVTHNPTTKEESAKIITNTAQISKDSNDDIDSVPKRDEVYNHNGGPNEDDIDFDRVRVKYFDLSLLKWVERTRITLNGKTTETKTGHTAETARNEAPVKIELKPSEMKKINIKYIYTIQIANEGEIEGYAKEITDYIPKGLKFVQEDNPNWYIIEDGVVGTKALEDTLLKPGETAEVQIILTWINSTDNFGEKVNLAEISEDYNEYESPDVDSTPNNQKADEDDIDDAPVILTVKTGSAQIYVGLILIILVTFAGGVGLIKKYVLE